LIPNGNKNFLDHVVLKHQVGLIGSIRPADRRCGVTMRIVNTLEDHACCIF
jgi:hypothetical protein